MDHSTFKHLIDQLSAAQPFRPYTLHLRSRSNLHVDHREQLAFNGNIVIHVGPQGTSMFDSTSVCSISVSGPMPLPEPDAVVEKPE